MLTDQKILLAGFTSDKSCLIESTLCRAGFSVCHIGWRDPIPEENIACVILNLINGEFDSASNLLRQSPLVQAGCISVLPASNDHARLLAMTMGTDDIVYEPLHYKELIAKVSILIDKYLDRRVGTNTFINDDIDLVQRFQDLSTSRYTGTMKLSGRDGRTACIGFDHGNIVHACVGSRSGSQAVASLWRVIPAQMALTSESVTPNIAPPLEVIRAASSITATIQTFQRISKPAPTLSSVCSVDWHLYKMSAARLPRQVRDLMPIFDGSNTMEQLLDSVPIDEQLLVKIFAKLARENILMFSNATTDALQLEQWVNSGPQSYASLPPVPVPSSLADAMASTDGASVVAQKKASEGESASHARETSISSDRGISLTELSSKDLEPSSDSLLLAEELDALHDIGNTPSIEEKLQDEIISLCKSGELFKVTQPEVAMPTNDAELRHHLNHLDRVQETDVSVPSVTLYRSDTQPTIEVDEEEDEPTKVDIPVEVLTSPLSTPSASSGTVGEHWTTSQPPQTAALHVAEQNGPRVTPKKELASSVSAQPSVPAQPSVSVPAQPSVAEPVLAQVSAAAKMTPDVVTNAGVAITQTPDNTPATTQMPDKASTSFDNDASEDKVSQKTKRRDALRTPDAQSFPSFAEDDEEEDNDDDDDGDFPEPIRHTEDSYRVFQSMTDDDELDDDESNAIEGQFFASATDVVPEQPKANLRSIPTPEEWQKIKLERTRKESLQKHRHQQAILGIGIGICVIVILALLISRCGDDEAPVDAEKAATAAAVAATANEENRQDEKIGTAPMPVDVAALAQEQALRDVAQNHETDEAIPTAADDAMPTMDAQNGMEADNKQPDVVPEQPAAEIPTTETAPTQAIPNDQPAAAPTHGSSHKNATKENTNEGVQAAKPRVIMPNSGQYDVALPDDDVAPNTKGASPSAGTKSSRATKSNSDDVTSNNDKVVKPKATVIMPSDSSGSSKQDKSSKSSKSTASASSKIPITAQLGQAQQALRAGKLDEARKTLEPALKSSPNDPRVNTLAARIEAKAGNLDKAIAYLKKTEAQNKSKPSYWKELGSYLQSSGKKAEARAAYQNAYKLLDAESTEAKQLLNRINSL